MEDIRNNKIIWAVLAITLTNIIVFGVGKVMVDKVTDRVIERLQREYSPSPYSPGFDPDKINPIDSSLSHGNFFNHMIASKEKSMKNDPNSKVVWRDIWETERGFSLAQ